MAVATMSVTGDSYNTENDGIFVVEYKTLVSFAFTQENGIFTYTYTFTLEGEEVTKLTYTMENNKYAMSSEVIENIREWYTRLDENDKATQYEFKESAGTTYLISPTFELKQYAGDLA